MNTLKAFIGRDQNVRELIDNRVTVCGKPYLLSDYQPACGDRVIVLRYTLLVDVGYWYQTTLFRVMGEGHNTENRMICCLAIECENGLAGKTSQYPLSDLRVVSVDKAEALNLSE